MLVAEGLLERLSQRQADVLHSVMKIDFEIALGIDVDVEQAMAAERVEHMVEKRHAGFDRRFAVSIDLQRNLDIGLFSLSLDLRHPSHMDLPLATQVTSPRSLRFSSRKSNAKLETLGKSRLHRARVIVQPFETR